MARGVVCLGWFNNKFPAISLVVCACICIEMKVIKKTTAMLRVDFFIMMVGLIVIELMKPAAEPDQNVDCILTDYCLTIFPL